MTTPSLASPSLDVALEGNTVRLRLSGAWLFEEALPPLDDVQRALVEVSAPGEVRLEAAGLESWDGGLVSYLARLSALCAARGVALDTSDLPTAAQRVLAAVERTGGSVHGSERQARPLVEAVGQWATEWFESLDDKLDFLGSTSLAIVRAALGRTRRLGVRLTLAFQEAGVATLPIVAVIAFALGAILTLLATQQLEKLLGAYLLAPKLVTIVVFRELGALLTGIALAGRLASANAAELAGAVADGEVDALRQARIDPFDVLVAPRVFALTVMGPLLVLYANALALLGGMLVGVSMMGIASGDYLEMTRSALGYKHAIAGLVKGVAFGFAVGMAGCYYGLSAGVRPGAVGRAARTAVVNAVLGVIIADTVLTLFFKWVRL